MASDDFLDRRNPYSRLGREDRWFHPYHMVPIIILVPPHNHLYGGIHDTHVPGKIERELTYHIIFDRFVRPANYTSSS